MNSWLAPFKRWFRRRPEIPHGLWQHTLNQLSIFDHLGTAERARLKKLSEEFLASKEFTGAQGLELQDAMLTNISAQACLPILELGLSAYRDWVGIIVYPGEFLVPRQVMDEAGVLHEYEDTVAGEAWEGGPVLISWQDAQLADGDYNVVIHEFAHKLDMLNGEVDGIPALHSGLQRSEWENVLYRAYDDFCHRLDNGEALMLDAYAAEHPSEFFAVTSESFFANPHGLQAAYPDLYQLLRRYYRQDPARRPT